MSSRVNRFRGVSILSQIKFQLFTIDSARCTGVIKIIDSHNRLYITIVLLIVIYISLNPSKSIKKMEPQSKKIAEVRSKAKLSRQKFAEKLGFSKSYITDVETGRAKPSRRLLEAISKEFNTSIDWILHEGLILDMIEENKKSGNPKIFFWFGFTQEELNEAERYLQNFLLKEKKSIYIDASKAGSLTQLLKMLVNKPGNSEKLNRIFREMLLDEPLIIILKSISLSKIPQKDSGKFIKNILNMLSYEWAENKEIDGKFTLVHKKPFCSLILIDFPSYLEVNMKTFGQHTIRINQSTIVAPAI